MELVALIGIDGADPVEAHGVCFLDMMTSIGFSAYAGHRVTYWKFVKGGDGYRDQRKPIEPPPKKLTKKAQKELEKLGKYLKKQ